MENNNSETTSTSSTDSTKIASKKRREKKMPICLRLPEGWIHVLNILVVHHNREMKTPTTLQGLIRFALKETYLSDQSIRNALSREGVFSEGEILKICKMTLKC